MQDSPFLISDFFTCSVRCRSVHLDLNSVQFKIKSIRLKMETFAQIWTV